VTSPRKRIGAIPAAIWPASTGAITIALATTGEGAGTRRSAMAWMIGSWAARLAVQSLFAPVPTPELPLFTSYFSLLSFSALFAVPAFVASRNPAPALSPVEIAAAAVWLLAFAGETTVDRQRLRFAAKAEHAGLVCRIGAWRLIPQAHAVCDVIIWSALALFATASPWGWIGWACPAARVYLLTRRD